MSDYWFTDMSQLAPEAVVERRVSAESHRMSQFLGKIIKAMEGLPRESEFETAVRCRTRIGGRLCRGEIRGVNLLDDPAQIFWECPVCGEQGKIFNFRGTPWDPRLRRPARILKGDFPGPESPGPPQDLAVFTPQAARLWDELEPGLRVLMLNKVHCCDCGGSVSMCLERANVAKGDIILRGRCLNCDGPVVRLVEAAG